MCDSHDTKTDISRRGLGLMTLAAGGLSVLPLGAKAEPGDHGVENLAIMCIDFRLVSHTIDFLNSVTQPVPPSKRYDLVALAGASLAGVASGLFEPTTHGFWQQVFAADKLHDVRRAIVIDHMGCGAFKEEFNGGANIPAPRERALHELMMRALDAKLQAYYPEMRTREYWLWPDPDTTRPYPTQPTRINI